MLVFMRGLTHRWIEPEATTPDRHWPHDSWTLEPVVGRLLRARGFSEPEDVRTFLEPRLTGLHPPEAMPGLDAAAARLLEALDRRETIAIYGDYDVDGVAATAILFHTLAMIDPALVPENRLRTYVPHRLDEGYGLNADALARLADEGARVVVTVDCGVTAIEEAARARALGLDLIITDHHLLPPDGARPDAVAIVHPRLGAPGAAAYPFPDLCGAGVAFKLAWRLAVLAHGSDRLPENQREILLDLLALTGLATITDVVPLRGENRILARFGLGRVKHTRLVGLRAVLEASGLAGQHVGSEEAGFTIGPRLNACGRMGHAADAVELLTTAGPERAMEIALALNNANTKRRSTERRIFEQACEMAEEAGMTDGSRRAIVLARDGWHPGVVGIVCSRLVGRFSRPAILLCHDEDRRKGSGRSVDGFDLHGALSECAEHLESFGGHEMAAGLAARADRLEGFVEAFTQVAARGVSDEMLVPSLSIDCEACLSELTPRAIEQIERLGPFGRANSTPRILVRGLTLRGVESLGAHGRHLKLRVSGAGCEMRLVAWGWGERTGALSQGMSIDAVVRPKINEWRGRRTVEPEVRDVRVAVEAASST